MMSAEMLMESYVGNVVGLIGEIESGGGDVFKERVFELETRKKSRRIEFMETSRLEFGLIYYSVKRLPMNANLEISMQCGIERKRNIFIASC